MDATAAPPTTVRPERGRWHSIDPRTRCIVPYTGACQSVIETAFIAHRPSVFLGEACWYATVHFDYSPVGQHYQTTPGFAGRAGKPGGYRDVHRIVRPMSPRIVRDTAEAEVEAEAPEAVEGDRGGGVPVPPRTSNTATTTPPRWIWEWCTDPHSYAASAQWREYPPRIQRLLENTTPSACVQFEVGARRFSIERKVGTCFTQQVDVVHGKYRPVRRRLLAETERLPSDSPPPPHLPDDVECSLCLNDAEAGLSKVFACGHRFHPVCVQIILDDDDPRCPNCRQPLIVAV